MDWQEEYQKRQGDLTRVKRKYYDFEEKLALPQHSRYYYDWLCSRYKSMPMEEKLADLGFLVTKGFDLQQSIRDYKVDREENITEAIPHTFIRYIIYMRFGKFLHIIEQVLKIMTEEELISLFLNEVKLRYEEYNHTVKTGDWNDKKLFDACTSKEVFERYVKTTEWTRKILTNSK